LTNLYTDRGELWKSYGSQSYPVERGYEAQGRLETLKTWQNFAGNSGLATNTWKYDGYRGFLTNKVYQDGLGPKYTYTAAGREFTRAWARGVASTNGYDYSGLMNAISYSDSTPGVSRTLDRRGRTKTITQNSITTTMAYNGAGRRLSESYSGGALSGLAVTNDFDSFQRRKSTIVAGYGGTKNGYTYDIAGRLSTVGDGTNVATYAYLANSPLVSGITFAQGATTRATTTKAYDYLERLSSILSTPSGTNMAALNFGYLYSDLNKKTRETWADGSAWVYGYDAKGQLNTGKRYWMEGEVVEGQQFEYTYDDIGNRTSTKEGGNAVGANLRSATYTPNTLNQYTGRSVPDKVNVIGSSTSTTTVQVNSSNADYRHGPYFREELSLSNTGTNAVWQSVTITAGAETTTGNLLIPGQTQNLLYDADGNLTNDYVWAYTYNAENRLVEARSLTNDPSASKKWLTFTYDYSGRRIQKTVATWAGSAWSLSLSNRFLYDGRNLIAELNATNNTLIQGYIWGQDLSGTLRGAGGVGGLVAINDADQGSHFVVHDGRGNVSALVKASDGSYSALYEYDPYGKMLRANGPMALRNPFHFSDKFDDVEVGLTFYGGRYYNASLGRWQNRDQIEEFGGFNVYGMVYNDPANYFDFDGRLAGSFAGVDSRAASTAFRIATATVEVAEGTAAVSAAAVAGVAVAATATAGLVGYDLSQAAQIHRLNTDIANLQQMTRQMERELQRRQDIHRGESFYLNDGEWRDRKGNVYDEDGNLVRDKFGNAFKQCIVQKKIGRGGVYILRDRDTLEIMRSGRTNDFDRRRDEHARDPDLKDLIFEEVYQTNDYPEQRGLEQILHDLYDPPLDKIRPVSPDNPNADFYRRSAEDYLNR
jgi:RHS repeat-associated protein